MAKGSDDDITRTICSICYEYLRPISEDLQAVSICGHVFHELCLQQWFEYCSTSKKITCPVCKQPCNRKNATRLYFQSAAETTPLQFCKHQSNSGVTSEEMQEQIEKLQAKASMLNGLNEKLQQQVSQLNVELSISKGRAKNEESLKEEALMEKGSVQRLVLLKNEELGKMSVEKTQLQDRCLALAKELATIKLVSDVNLDEEQISKLATLGAGTNKDLVVDILQKSLILRNQKYKDLMVQCNQLGRGEVLSQRKLEKAEEKIKKLKARLHEMGKEFEEKDNKLLRVEMMSSRFGTGDAFCSANRVESNFACSPREMETVAYNMGFLHRNSTIPIAVDLPEQVSDRDDCVIVLDKDDTSLPYVKVNGSHPASSSMPEIMQKSGAVECKNSVLLKPNLSTTVQNKMGMAENAVVVCDRNPTSQEPSASELQGIPPIKREISGLLGAENGHKFLSRWCKQGQNNMSSELTGDLISVGPDGRGGRTKALRKNPFVDKEIILISPKRFKVGTKQNIQQGCMQIENYFIKRELS